MGGLSGSSVASGLPAWIQALGVAHGERRRRGRDIVGASVLGHTYAVCLRVLDFAA